MAEIISSLSSWFTPTSLFIFLNLVIGTIAVISALGKEQKQQQQQQQQHDDQPEHQQQQHDDQPEHQVHQHQQFSELMSSPPPPRQFSRTPSFFSRVTSFSNYLSSNSSSPSQSHAYSFRSEADYTTQAIPFPSSTAQSYLFHEEERDDHPKPTISPALLTRSPSLLSRVTSFGLSFRNNNSDLPHSNNPTTTQEEQEQELHQQHHMERTASEPAEVAEPADEAAAKMRKTASAITRAKKKMVAPEELLRKSETPAGTGRVVRNRARETTAFDGEVDSKADDFINRFKQQLRLQRLDSLIRYRHSPAATAQATK